MKKLMIALAVVACAMAVQASTYNWKQMKGQIYQAGSTSAKVASGTTVYLFDANKFDQTALVKALFIDNTYASLSAAATAKGITTATTTVNGSAVVAQTSDWTYDGESAGTKWNAYYALVDGDNVFISGNSPQIEASALSSAVGIAFDVSPKTASQAAALDGSKGYDGMGWYTAAPEPTSGLLLLIGMAGLALKRKRT